MTLPRALTLLLIVSLLLQPAFPVMALRSTESARPDSLATPSEVPVQADRTELRPTLHAVSLPLRYHSGEEAAPQQPTPAGSPNAALRAVSAANGPLFIENVGQFDPQARFVVRGSGGNLFLANDALWLTVLEQPQEPLTSTLTMDVRQATDKDQVLRGVNLKMSFIDANSSPRLEPFNRLDTHVSYFIGNDPAKWHADVPVWGGVRYVDLYPGIDLEVTNERGELQQRLVVRDSAPLAQVRLKVEGAQTMATHRSGNRSVLRLATAVSEFDLPLFEVAGLASNSNLSLPTIQDNVVTAPFANAPMRTPGLQSPFWEGLSSSLTITPTPDLLFSTFLGGSAGVLGYNPGGDGAFGIAVDANGNIYVVGNTWSTDFPTTTNAFSTTLAGLRDAFASKFSYTGPLEYSTYLGSPAEDWARDVAVNSSGEAYVTGATRSSDEFPTTSNAFTHTAQTDAAFVTKFNATGTGLLYSTYLGTGEGHGIVVDANDIAYIVGHATGSALTPFPTTSSAIITQPLNTDPYQNNRDAFVSKIGTSLTGTESLLYSTLLGGTADDCDRSLDQRSECDIALGSDGTVYIAGKTYSTNFLITTNLYRGAGYDAFVAKIDTNLSQMDSLLYSAYLGGNGEECYWGCSIAVDPQGFAYIAGSTGSTNFPTTTGALQPQHAGPFGSLDAFVAKIDTTQSGPSGLVYSTYLGGTANDSEFGFAIAVDATGIAYVAGDTSSTDFLTTTYAYQPGNRGQRDAFLSVINLNGTGLLYSTYLGGTNPDYGMGIALGAGGVYVVGQTESPNFPVTQSQANPPSTAKPDAFVTVFSWTALLDSMVRTLSCPLCSLFSSRNHWGRPIDTLSGNYTYQKLDESIPVLGGSLAFERSYSADTRSLFTRTLGYGWTHNQEIRLAFPTDPGGVAGQVLLQAPGGSQLPFFDLGDGNYQPYPGVTAGMSRIMATEEITTYVVTATNQTVYTFNAAGRVTQTISPAGNVITYTYYPTGSLQTAQSYGRSLRFFYDERDRLTTVLDPIDRVTQFSYDTNGDLANVVDTRGLTWTYEYSGTTHLLNRVLDPDQKIVERTVFDEQSRAVQQYNGRDELVVQLEFGSGGVITVTDGLNRTAVDRYGRGTWLGGTDTASQAITRTYDANFKPTYVADPNGRGPQIQWSADGSNLKRVVDAGGYTTTMEYDGLNNPTLITDTRGFTTAYEYSGSLLTRQTDALGHTTIYTYGQNNLLIAQQDALGRVTEYQYDEFGQRTVVTDALQNVTRYEYDLVGRLITTTDAIGRVTVNVYDNADHLIAVTNNYTSTTTEQNYLDSWNLITRYGYDGFGRQIAMTDTLDQVSGLST